MKFHTQTLKPLVDNKKIFFASDFHLGIPNKTDTLLREKKLVKWLESIQKEVHALFLLGDIFDFWFEYKYVIPKGFARLQGKLAEFSDRNIPVFLFIGNHDHWISDYFSNELNIAVCRQPVSLVIGEKKILVGHGDEFGASKKYGLAKKFIYYNPLCQWIFRKIPPNIGMAFAHYISQKSRIKTLSKKTFSQENDPIFNFCKQKIAPYTHHDFYVFGHLHCPLTFRMHEKSWYYNLGDWINHFTYGTFDGTVFKLLKFKEK